MNVNVEPPVLIAFVAVAIILVVCFVQLATRIVCGFFPPFFQTCGAMLGAGIVALAFAGGVRYFLGESATELVPSLIASVFSFLLQTSIFGAVIKKPDGEGIGFWKAFLVNIVGVVLSVLLVFGLSIAFPAIFDFNAVKPG